MATYSTGGTYNPHPRTLRAATVKYSCTQITMQDDNMGADAYRVRKNVLEASSKPCHFVCDLFLSPFHNRTYRSSSIQLLPSGRGLYDLLGAPTPPPLQNVCQQGPPPGIRPNLCSKAHAQRFLFWPPRPSIWSQRYSRVAPKRYHTACRGGPGLAAVRLHLSDPPQTPPVP